MKSTLQTKQPGQKPSWLKRNLPTGSEYEKVRQLLSRSNLHTVCQEAKCPNMWECFSRQTSTFMIMGDQCTRNCRFCNVKTGNPLSLDPGEPTRVAKAALELGLKYVVITSVTRDDLEDGGASHFAATINQIRNFIPQGIKIEVLIPDFQGSPEALNTVMEAWPDVLNHNIETVPSLYSTVRPEAQYERSLELIQRASRYEKSSSLPKVSSLLQSPLSLVSLPAKEQKLLAEKNSVISGSTTTTAISRTTPVKSGIMVGLGETKEELQKTIQDLYQHGCRILTIGQYLQPSAKHLPVMKYYEPKEFDELKEFAESMGFESVASAPFVRSSYEA
ncbi:MAG: lipoyl synthase, partial [Desulfamplus sp.]|nr:lipoyl synthase [Desulfamplus sp.]